MTKHAHPRREWTAQELAVLAPHARSMFHGASCPSRLKLIKLPGRTPGAVRAQLLKLVGVMLGNANGKHASPSAVAVMERHRRIP